MKDTINKTNCIYTVEPTTEWHYSFTMQNTQQTEPRFWIIVQLKITKAAARTHTRHAQRTSEHTPCSVDPISSPSCHRCRTQSVDRPVKICHKEYSIHYGYSMKWNVNASSRVFYYHRLCFTIFWFIYIQLLWWLQYSINESLKRLDTIRDVAAKKAGLT